ncbi:MAG: autotransporter outer membrane beta-barrel domain-containing protein [Spirochaetes bacterium]|nr:autotransporter outer membrane beta-barrel domain-containing protein [Spirochaetota bacterium]
MFNLKLIVKLFISIPVFIILQSAISAQSVETAVSSKAIKGLTNVVESIISDSFVPMTEYDKGDYTVSFVPAVFEIDTVFTDPDVRGDDLYGGAAGIGGGYAFTDKIMFYGIFSALKISGGAKGDFYGDVLSEQKIDIDYSMICLSTGAGYDFFDSDRWSFPVYAGITLQKHAADFSAPQVTDGPYTYSGEVTSDSLIFGLTAAAAVSYNWRNKFSITPYFLYMHALNNAGAEVKLNLVPAGTVSRNFDAVRYSGGMPGINIGYSVSPGFSFSLSAGGMLTSSTSFYNKTFLDGLKMKSLILAFTYNGNFVRSSNPD